MSHQVWNLTSDSHTWSDIRTKYASLIESAWKEVFPDGKFEEASMCGLGYLTIPDKVYVNLTNVLEPQIGVISDDFRACVLEPSVRSNNDAGIGFYKSFAGAYGVKGGSVSSTEWTGYGPACLHMITGKNKKSIMIGLSDSEDRVGAQVVVASVGDGYVSIQLGINDYNNLYERRDAVIDYSDQSPNDRYDGYIKDDLISKTETQICYGPSMYPTNNILSIAPAIDPWRAVTIPDVYVSICAPLYKVGLDGIISIGNRKFMTGHTYSYKGTSAMIWSSYHNHQCVDGGPVTFIEI